MSLHNSNALKGLETKLATLEQERNTQIQIVTESQTKLTKLKGDINAITNEIWKLKNSKTDIVVTEHAVLRYIQHVMGIDLEEVSRNILPEPMKNNALLIGDGKYHLGGVTRVVKDGAVVTVYADAN